MTNRQTIFLVSPWAHYPSHNWPNTVALMRALNRKGCRVRTIVFSTGTEPVPPDLCQNVEPVFVRLPEAWKRVAAGKWQNRRFGGLMNVCETLACLFKALKLARDQPNAVLHFIGGSYWTVVLATLFFRRLRFVYSLYGAMLSGSPKGVKAWLRPRLKKLLHAATATGRLDFTCENEFLRDENAALVGSHVRLIPYAIDDDENLPSQEEARRQLDLPPEEKIILFFGTHRREKDYATPLKGCLTLSVPPLALFVGKVISDNDPRQAVADCRYPKVRIVNDFVPEEMAKFYFAAADAVILPYEAEFTRGSGVLIECCRHRRPMIASATPYFVSFLNHYPCGVSYVPGNSTSFAAAAENLLSGGVNCRTALEQARHDHSWSTAADQYIQLYEGISLTETDQPKPAAV